MGQKNVILNEAFKTCVNLNSEWLQGIQSLLCVNGFGNIWLDPHSANGETFHKIFQQRLRDQFVQISHSKLSNSSRFITLGILGGITHDHDMIF